MGRVGNLFSVVCLLLSLIVFFASCGTCLCDRVESIHVPDILVWIDTRVPQSTWVSLTYSKAISKTQVEADLQKILKETGWVAANVTISDGETANVGEPPMTTVEFSTVSSVVNENGVLAIEPIVIALRGYKRFEILYIVPPHASFLTPDRFENKYVKIALERGKNSYRYTVDIKNPGFDVLKLPSSMPKQVEQQTAVRKRLYLLLPLAIILALLVGVTTFLIASSVARSRGHDCRRRS